MPWFGPANEAELTGPLDQIASFRRCEQMMRPEDREVVWLGVARQRLSRSAVIGVDRLAIVVRLGVELLAQSRVELEDGRLDAWAVREAARTGSTFSTQLLEA